MQFPRKLKSKRRDGDHEWQIVDGCSAQLGVAPDERVDDEVARVDQTTVICQRPVADPDNSPPIDNQVPVYQLGGNGPIAVPTGRIFVHFDKGTSLEEHRAQLEQLGFQIDELSQTSGACGWIRHQSGCYRETLTRSATLHNLENLSTVEPQLLMARQSKTARPPR